MATLLPDFDNGNDLFLSALGGVLGLLTCAYVTSSRGCKPAVGAGALAAGILGGHKLYEHIADDCAKRALLNP